MEISSHERDISVPISSSYAGMVLDNSPQTHIIQSFSSPISSNGPISPNLEDCIPLKKVVRYRECLKNHAAAMGGNATDGCGEFMPSGEEGTLEALKCSACNCHRNFHRKEIDGQPSSCGCYYYNPKVRKLVGQKGVLIAGPEAFGYPTGSLLPRPLPPPSPPPPPHLIMSYNMGHPVPEESDEQEGVGPPARPTPLVKKRFRTKFTQDQKEKMLGFAEKVGWRIQKQEEGLVQQFCHEIGIKRRVLKVWMHNNKQHLAKKSSI